MTTAQEILDQMFHDLKFVKCDLECHQREAFKGDDQRVYDFYLGGVAAIDRVLDEVLPVFADYFSLKYPPARERRLALVVNNDKKAV